MKTQTLLLASILAFVPKLALAVDGQEGPGDTEETGGSSTPETPPPGTVPTWTKSLNNSQCFPDCSASWGAGYSIGGKLAATPRTATTRDKLEGWAELDTFAKMNGGRYSIFKVRVAGVSEAKLRTDLGLTAYVGGFAIFTKPFVAVSGSYTPLAIGQTWTQTFFDRSMTVGVGPIPVTFRARASGQVGAALTGKISNVGFEVNAGPSGKASLFASAAVGGAYCVEYLGCVGAQAGLSVNVTLFEVSAPVNYSVWYSLVNLGYGAQLNYGLNANIVLKSLSGYLSVFAEACLGGCWRWDRDLISWGGFQGTYPLLNVAGKYCLLGDCSAPVSGFGL